MRGKAFGFGAGVSLATGVFTGLGALASGGISLGLGYASREVFGWLGSPSMTFQGIGVPILLGAALAVLALAAAGVAIVLALVAAGALTIGSGSATVAAIERKP